MSEFTRILFALLVATAPLGVLPVFAAYLRDTAVETRFRAAAVAGVTSLALLTLAAVIGDPFLDWIEVSPENFRIAAGVIMGPVALRMLLTGDSMATPDEADGKAPLRAWFVPLAFPLIAGPASLAAALSYATRFGEGETIGAAAIAAGVAAAACAASPWVLRALGVVPVRALGRLNGALLMVVVVELMVDGIQSV